MANEYFVNSADLTSVADAIRAKGETTDLLVFPAGFVTAVEAITSGGGGLNFEVVGGTTQPPEPVDNTLWVNTSVDIGKWTVAPYGVEGVAYTPSVGDVWIMQTLSGTVALDVQDENDFIFYPFTAYQYTANGSWETQTIEVYRDGEWLEIAGNIALYDNGRINETLTGGFDATITPKYNADSFYVGTSGYIYSANKIDVTPYNTLKIVAINENGDPGKFGLNDTQALGSSYGTIAEYTDVFTVFNFDISEYSGSYYFVFYCKSKTTVKSITMEV